MKTKRRLQKIALYVQLFSSAIYLFFDILILLALLKEGLFSRGGCLSVELDEKIRFFVHLLLTGGLFVLAEVFTKNSRKEQSDEVETWSAVKKGAFVVNLVLNALFIGFFVFLGIAVNGGIQSILFSLLLALPSVIALALFFASAIAEK